MRCLTNRANDVPTGRSSVALVQELVVGPNFSGRSRHIHKLADSNDAAFLVNADVSGLFSGVASTLSQELDLFSSNPTSQLSAKAFVIEAGFAGILEKNPLLLSGGQQVIAALALAIAGLPCTLLLDCCLEQLDRRTRSAVFDLLAKHTSASIVVADNRFDEYLAPPAAITTLMESGSDRVTAMGSISFDRPCSSGRIEIQGLSAHYPSDRSFGLRVPELRIEPGRVYRLIGPNGAGKSTFSKVLVGLLKADQGQIQIGGSHTDPWEMPGRLVSLAFQNPDHQLFSTTCFEELLSRGCSAERAEDLLTRFGLLRERSEHPHSLPFVMRKRLSLAAALAAERAWYIFDEPTLGQDSRTVGEISSVLTEMAHSGIGVIIITHSELLSSKLSPSDIVVTNGRVEPNNE